jgi:hypothetical protein
MSTMLLNEIRDAARSRRCDVVAADKVGYSVMVVDGHGPLDVSLGVDDDDEEEKEW